MEIASSVSESKVHAFEGKMLMSAYQPVDIKPVYGRKWVTNGINNINYQVYKNAYDDSPTNSSIINAFVSYIFGEGLIAKDGRNIDSLISQEDALMICHDYYTYGGYSVQIIWSKLHTPLKVKYIPVYKLGVNYDQQKIEVDGFWYSWDWSQRARYPASLYPKFTGEYNGNNLEILMVRRPTAEPFFPVPSYLSGIPWAMVEGELANAGKNHFKNAMTALTVINYNNGRISDPVLAKKEADRIRDKAVGTDNQGATLVSFNDGAEESVTVDQLHPPELNQQNVFYSEEAERKIIVAHSAPPVLFSGSNQGSGFSSNADEIAVVTKGLYRRHINPIRGVILKGLESILKIELDFKDFEEETEITSAEGQVTTSSLDEKTLEAQANLKGSVGGVQSLLEIQASYSQGLTTYESAINMLDLIFGYSREQAVRLLGAPKKEETL